jgi:hypothetical protein
VPGKAAYLALDGDPDLEFEFFLASKLGVMVADLRERMSMSEYVMWTRYYARKAQRDELAARA